ncbi:PKD domain-containing protein [Halorussus marinus]|uniref:PKD domain-containing protein n=1 Tax=Halorussus marinus TaxID=2505976 RepID=UPI0010924C8A|nr:PKD domain-containing protein [Halorussus marinus]
MNRAMLCVIAVAVLAAPAVGTVGAAPTPTASASPPAADADEPLPERWNTSVGGDGDDKLTTGIRTDGGYLVVGWTAGDDGTDDGYVAMVDEAGRTTWERSYGGPGTDRLFDVKAVEDGYLLAGYSSPDADSAWDGWVLKVDDDGEVVWEETHGGDGPSGFWSLAKSGDTVYAGGWQKGSTAEAWLVELESDGTQAWSQTYDTLKSNADEYVNSIFVADDGDLLLTGTVESSTYDPSDAWVLNVDAEGEVNWDAEYGGADADRIHDAAATEDGGFLLAGRTASQGDGAEDGWLVKIDGGGDKQWERTYGTEKDDAFYGVLADDDGVVLSGAKHKLGQTGADGWLVKADSEGQTQWERTYGNQYWDKFWPAIDGHGGGYVGVGDTTSYSENQDGWLVRIGGPASAAIRDADADRPGTTVALEDSPVRSVTLADANASGVLTVSERANLSALAPPGDPVYAVTLTGPAAAANASATVELSVPTDAAAVEDLRVAQRAADGWAILDTEVVAESNATARLSAAAEGTGTLAVTAVDAPTASIDAAESVLVGESVELSAADSAAEDGRLTGYRWEIDGERYDGETATVSFDDPGEREVALTVTDSAALNDTATATLVVNDRPGVTVDAPDSVTVGSAATFSADVTDSVGETTVTWRFGDAEVTGESVEHSFGTSGTATVEVVVEDEYGATATESVTVTVDSQAGDSETTRTTEAGGADGGVPGFGVAAALVALAAAVLSARRVR